MLYPNKTIKQVKVKTAGIGITDLRSVANLLDDAEDARLILCRDAAISLAEQNLGRPFLVNVNKSAHSTD